MQHQRLESPNDFDLFHLSPVIILSEIRSGFKSTSSTPSTAIYPQPFEVTWHFVKCSNLVSWEDKLRCTDWDSTHCCSGVVQFGPERLKNSTAAALQPTDPTTCACVFQICKPGECKKCLLGGSLLGDVPVWSVASKRAIFHCRTSRWLEYFVACGQNQAPLSPVSSLINKLISPAADCGGLKCWRSLIMFWSHDNERNSNFLPSFDTVLGLGQKEEDVYFWGEII